MSIAERIRQSLKKPASRWVRFFREIFIDFGCVLLALFITHVLFGRSLDEALQACLRQGLPVAGLAILLLLWRGIYSIDARYIGLHDSLNIGFVGILLAAGFAAANRQLLTTSSEVLPWGGILLFGFIAMTLLGGSRIAQRMYTWRRLPQSQRRDGGKLLNTLIVGAGDAGEMIMREIRRSRSSVTHVIGFVDDNPEKLSLRIHGVPVLGTSRDIPRIAHESGIDEIIIAIPSAEGTALRRIIDACNETAARVRILPALASVLRGSPQLVHHLREVDIEDLLRRDPVKTDLKRVAKYINGETVMITGAGGSIGSELARQIAELPPARLILLGRGENSIFEIEQELIQASSFCPTTIIADVRDRQSMEAVFRDHRPAVVFHAAAHKHVPLMEAHPLEAIKNNVLGTWLTAELAIRYGVKSFIYVSTDKAVNPSSIMGATKRIGEMIVSALGQRSDVGFSIVRFGNVLGSRGSLLPLLKAQIKLGGPVRVTHPDMTRFFMTIPEAVQLIVQAGALGAQGEIFLLDMGAPVRILDLASDLIRLHGLVPGEDIKIQFSGVRPGEKMHEELSYSQEQLLPTEHPKIGMISNHRSINWDWLKHEIDALLGLCEEGSLDLARQTAMDLAWGRTPGSFAVVEDMQEEADASTERA